MRREVYGIRMKGRVGASSALPNGSNYAGASESMPQNGVM